MHMGTFFYTKKGLHIISHLQSSPQVLYTQILTTTALCLLCNFCLLEFFEYLLLFG